MKHLTLPLMGALVAGCMNTSANAESFSVTGKVISSEPKYTTVTNYVPRNVCTNVQIPIYGSQPRQSSSGMGAIVGGLAGGILGNQIGGGSGKTAATIGGAILGGVVGNNVEDRTNANSGTTGQIVGYRQEQRCQVQHDQVQNERLSGYMIRYEALGFKGSVLKPNRYNVGDSIDVKVTLNAR